MIDTLLRVFRKVSLMEDSDQNIHLKNLSVHQANSEEEALNLLFLGDTNRMIAEVSLHLYIHQYILWGMFWHTYFPLGLGCVQIL